MKKRPKTFAEKAYQGTNVNWQHTKTQIENMLIQLGIENIRFTTMGNDVKLEFFVKLQKDEFPRKVIMELPILDNLEDTKVTMEHRKNVQYRVFFHHLRDKFIIVQNGIREFEEEFMSDLAIIHNGVEVRLGDIIVPKYKAQLKDASKVILSIK